MVKEQEGNNAIAQYNGISRCEKVNSSHCQTTKQSGLYCYMVNEAAVKYCSFNSNSVTRSTCVYLDVNNGPCVMEYCNIINNTQQNNEFGLISCRGKTNITNCCIFENGNSPIIEANEYPVHVIGCSYDNNQIIETQEHLIEFINDSSIDFIYGIKFYNSANCYASYDAVGSLPVIIIPDFEKKKPTHKYSIIYGKHSHKYRNYIFIWKCVLDINIY